MNSRALTVLLASALLGAGCASQTDSTTTAASAATASSANADRIAEQQRKISMLETELRNKERQVSTLSTDLEQARTGSMGASSATGVGTDLFPPNPRPGECYARVVIPAKQKTSSKTVLKKEASERIEIVPARYETVKERVLVKEASSKLEVVPARYELAEERVLVKPASTKLEAVPATYKTVTERVLVKPASQKVVEVPAVYKTVTERVMDQPARTEWKRSTGQGAGQGIARASGGAAAQIERFGDLKVVETRVEDTGEVMCLVEIPATFRTIEKRMLASPAATRTIDIPAEYESITKQVVDRPAATREVTIPAQYKTIKVNQLASPSTTRTIEIPAVYKTVDVRKQVSPAAERRIPIPAEYENVTLTEKIADERIEWRPVLCEVNMTLENVSALQSALSKTGCCRCGPNRNECQIDGIMGPCTIQASRCYANKKGLPSGDKYVTMEIIRSLGLKF